MSLLAVLLAAVGAADIARLAPARVSRRTEEACATAIGVIVALLIAIGLGYRWHSIWIAIVGGGVVAAWCWRISRPDVTASAGGRFLLRVAVLLPLILPAGVLLAVVAGQQVPRSRPLISHWYESLEISGLARVPVADAALAFGVALFLVQSANVVVRRVLTAAGPDVIAEEQQLKGGRILGPIERLAIFALALSGNVAAISAVVAAKGILRFPEINRDAASGLKAEYVLVGSFVSWGLAMVFVPLF